MICLRNAASSYTLTDIFLLLLISLHFFATILPYYVMQSLYLDKNSEPNKSCHIFLVSVFKLAGLKEEERCVAVKQEMFCLKQSSAGDTHCTKSLKNLIAENN